MRHGRRLPTFLLIAALLAIVVLAIPHATFAQTGGFKLVPECARTPNPGPGQPAPAPPSLSCLLQVFGNVAQIILGLTGSIALLMFVYAGFTLLTAAGNDAKVTKGKEILKTAVIGIIIILAGGTVIRYGLSQLVKENQVIGQACQNGQGTVIQKADGTLACATSCGSAGEGYTCIATSQAQNRACIGGLCAADQLCCQTGPTGQ